MHPAKVAPTPVNLPRLDRLCSTTRAGRRLLLLWLEQQGGGAAAALDSVKTTLMAAKTAARKRQLADHAAKVKGDQLGFCKSQACIELWQ